MQGHGVGYGPPAHGQCGVPQQSEWLRNEAGVVVAPHGAPWPDRCVKCNAPAEGIRIKQTVYWHPAWMYLLILPGVLIYAIVAMIERKTYTTEVGLCPKHNKQRNMMRAGAGLLTVASMGSCGAGLSMEVGALLGVSVALFAVGMGCAIGARNLIRAKKIDTHYAWLKTGRPFTDALPPPG
ncbi:MAG: hypothetical protein AAGA54_27470 [Myxococcota bacterium]